MRTIALFTCNEALYYIIIDADMVHAGQKNKNKKIPAPMLTSFRVRRSDRTLENTAKNNQAPNMLDSFPPPRMVFGSSHKNN